VLIAEPPRTPYDLNFTLAGFPVRVHPFFWIVALLLGTGGGTEPTVLLTWVAVVFVSILVHELGHAFAIRFYGWQPSITLYALGGVASYSPGFTSAWSSYQRRGNSPAAQILISAAGPAAGFLLAGLIILLLYLSQRSTWFLFDLQLGTGPEITNENVGRLVFYLLFVNFFWGLLNLLPVYPLDGGKIAREVLLMFSPNNGVRQSLILSMVTSGALAVYSVVSLGSIYMALLFGYLAYSSYTMLQGFTGGGFGGRFGGRPW
jgi:Zn-dependent protease